MPSSTLQRKGGPPPNIAPPPRHMTRNRHFVVVNVPSPLDEFRFADVLLYALEVRALAPMMVDFLKDNGLWAERRGGVNPTYAYARFQSIVQGAIQDKGTATIVANERISLIVVDGSSTQTVQQAAKIALASQKDDYRGTEVTCEDVWVYSGPIVRGEAGSLGSIPPAPGSPEAATAGLPSLAFSDGVLPMGLWSTKFGVPRLQLLRTCVDAPINSASVPLLIDAKTLRGIDDDTFLTVDRGANGSVWGSLVGYHEAIREARLRFNRHSAQFASISRFFENADNDAEGNFPSYLLELIDRASSDSWKGKANHLSNATIAFGGTMRDKVKPNWRRATTAAKAREIVQTWLGGRHQVQTKGIIECVSDVVNSGVRIKLPPHALKHEAAAREYLAIQFKPKLPVEEGETIVSIAEAAMEASGQTIDVSAAPRAFANSSETRSNATANTIMSVSRLRVKKQSNERPPWSTLPPAEKRVVGPQILGPRFRVTFFRANSDSVLIESRDGMILFNGGDPTAFSDVIWPAVEDRWNKMKLVIAGHCGTQYIGGLLSLYRFLNEKRRDDPKVHVPKLMIGEYGLGGTASPTEVAHAMELTTLVENMGVRVWPESFDSIGAHFKLITPEFRRRQKAYQRLSIAPSSKSHVTISTDCDVDSSGLAFLIYHRPTDAKVLVTGHCTIEQLEKKNLFSPSMAPAPETNTVDVVQVPAAGAVLESDVVPASKFFVATSAVTDPLVLKKYATYHRDVHLFSTEFRMGIPDLPNDNCASGNETAVMFTFHGSGLCETNFIPEREPPLTSLETQRSGLSPYRNDRERSMTHQGTSTRASMRKNSVHTQRWGYSYNTVKSSSSPIASPRSASPRSSMISPTKATSASPKPLKPTHADPLSN